ncbi:MAG TPA: DUF6455 family protein [Microvirga sp.]|jgi:hypothetical protein|nr:DUF6455 family protein [Microvirga sp.]
MDRPDSAPPGPFDWMFASVSEWGRLVLIAQEVRGADGDLVEALLDDRMAGGSLSRAEAEKVLSLARLLAALDLDAAAIRRTDPASMTALEGACLRCTERARCDRALADGTAAESHPEFCPNAPRLGALASVAAAAR